MLHVSDEREALLAEALCKSLGCCNPAEGGRAHCGGEWEMEEASLVANSPAFARILDAARAEALREAAQNTLDHNAWGRMTRWQKFAYLASRGDSHTWGPEAIAQWLNERADAIDRRRRSEP